MDDSISRQAAINVAYENMICDDDEITCEVIGHIAKDISLLPSTDRPIGKWISQCSKDWRGGGAEICSECGYGYSWGAFHEPDEFKFCPNCGAKMDRKNRTL